MVFSSLVFLFRFLPIVLIMYYLLPGKAKNFWLFLASLFFYAWGEPIYILIMLFSTFFDYTNGRLMENASEKKKKLILIISLVGNLGILFFFKYIGFFSDIVSHVGIRVPVFNFTLPLGISFYTFQTLSYTIDCYRGRVKACKNIITFGLYVASFPQLIAGPIVKYIQIEDELENRKDDLSNIYLGGITFLRGLFMKVLLANTFGEIYEMYSFKEASSIVATLIKLFSFHFQIFFDFAGYSKMAIGLGKMFGFNFPENFNYPYISQSVREFWTRWHITLSSWFKEYVYIPLGGNRVSVSRHIFNLFITWLLTGLWHGANLNYVVWGIYYFILLILEKYVLSRYLKNTPSFIKQIYTFIALNIGWVLFIAEDFKVVSTFFNNFIEKPFIDPKSIAIIFQYITLFMLGVLFSTPKMKEIFEKWPSGIKHFCYLALFILSVAAMASGAYNPFLYFRF